MSIAVIGCGYWGKNLIRNFSELNALTAVCDSNQALVSNFAQKYAAKAMTYDEILASDIQGIVIAAPAPLHADLALKAFSSGKHVFVEKPLAMNVVEADMMIEAASSSGCHLMVGHLLQYHPVFVKLREMVSNGELGKLSYIYSNRLSFGKVRSEENVIWSFAPHDISMILSLANDSVKSVACYTSEVLQNEIADSGVLHIEFKRGLKSHICCSWLHPIKEQKLVVIGQHGMAIFDDTKEWEEKLMFYDHKVDMTQLPPLPVKADAVNIKVPKGEPLKAECNYFLDLMQGKVEPLTDGLEGRSVLDVLEKGSSFNLNLRNNDA